MAKETIWSKLGVQRRPTSVSDLLTDVAAVTLATNHRYVWRGIKNAHYTLHSALERRLIASKIPVSASSLRNAELALIAQAKASSLIDRQMSDAETLALLQHVGASTSLLDVTPDPYIALFFATEPVGSETPCALVAIRVPGKEILGQTNRTHKGPLANATGLSVYGRLKQQLALPDDYSDPILWEAPYIDDRMKAQRGMFLATTAPNHPFPHASFNPNLSTADQEKSRVENLCKRAPGQYHRPSLVVFYISKRLRTKMTRELDRRFGYRTETIYPDLNGFALANAPTRMLQAQDLLAWEAAGGDEKILDRTSAATKESQLI